MSATCPSCGVAVVPGYVRCPKCLNALPKTPVFTKSAIGGTSLGAERSRGALLGLIAVAIVGIGLFAYFGLRTSESKPAPAAPAPAQPTETAVNTPDTPDNAGGPSEAAQPAEGPSPALLATQLERTLKKQRLWSTVSADGDRVDVRSGSCADAAMKAALDAAAPSLKAAGLTKLRCLEQSGQVVSTRDL